MDADLDDVIRRLRERADDPDRRVDCRTSAFAAGVAGLDLGGLMGQLGQAQADLARLLAAGPEGPPPDLVARADQLAADMSAPAESALRPPASAAALDAAERALGVTLPPVLRRALGEVADGGFGPAYGLLGAEAMAAETAAWRSDGGFVDWPAGLVVVAELGCAAWACVDTSDPAAPVWDLDPSEAEGEDDPIGDLLAPLAPSLVSWLDDWARSPSPAEQEAESLRAMAADVWAQEPQTELDHLRREWMREQGLAPPD